MNYYLLSLLNFKNSKLIKATNLIKARAIYKRMHNKTCYHKILSRQIYNHTYIETRVNCEELR